MGFRFLAASGLGFVLIACGGDSAGPPPPVPPPPPPPPGPTVAMVTSALEPSQIAIVNGVLYWSDASETPFSKLALSGGAPVGLFEEVPVPEGEISDGAHVYWVSGAALFRTTLDGVTTSLLDVGAGAGGTALALDATSVYWVSSIPQGSCSPDCKFAIRRVPKAGGAGATIATTTDGVFGVTSLAVAGGDVFWEESAQGPVDSAGSVGSKIQRVPAAGGSVTTVVDGRLNGLIPPPSGGFIPASWRPSGGIVADTDFVYFADGEYRVMAVPVSGGAVDVLFEDTTSTITDLVRSLTHDSATLYWIDENDVRALPKSGGAVVGLALMRDGRLGNITRSGATLYWIESDCCLVHGNHKIYAIPTTGGTPMVVHDSLVTPVSLTSDASHLIWIEGGPYGDIEGYGGLRASALDGSNPVSVIEAAGAGPFATDGTAIYFANLWTIKSVSTSGGAPRRLAIGSFYVKDIATDGTRIYWVEDGPFSVVRSVAVTGGPVTTLASGPGPAGRIRLDGTYVYWLGHDDEIHRVSKAGGASVKVVGPISGLATDFDVDATTIYISGWDSGVISRVPLAGGTPTPITTPGPDQTRRIAAHGGKVYWIDQVDVKSVTADGLTVVTIHQGILSDPFTSNGLAFDNQSVYWSEIAMDAIRKATPK